jgi:S1-C subfamily serine protease
MHSDLHVPANVRPGARRRRVLHALAWASLATCLWVAVALAVPGGSTYAPPAARPQSEQTVDALSVVKLRSKAVPDARSNRTLGSVREGTGVVIDADGLVLTIGYLILEAETVELVTARGDSYPAAVFGYDSATGFGLVKSLRPLPIKPIPFGRSSNVAVRDPVLIVGFDGVAPAYVVSRRQFTGYWEYLLDDAIYTAPATVNWSGAALLNREGKLVGIGSLSVNDAAGPDSQLPGNLFVPSDLLNPLLGDLVTRGKSSAPPRPWLGVRTQEVHGNVIVMHVSPESPAEAAMRPGDVIVAVGDQVIKGQADFYLRVWSRGEAGVEIPLEVLREGRIQKVAVKSIDRETYYRARRIY